MGNAAEIRKRVSMFLTGGGDNIDEYIAYIKENQAYVDVYCNLDVIGDPVRTWENQRYMERQGLKPLPVYHGGEPREYLDRCQTWVTPNAFLEGVHLHRSPLTFLEIIDIEKLYKLSGKNG